MKTLPYILAVTLTVGCSQQPEQEAAERLILLPDTTCQRLAEACDKLIAAHAPSEQAIVYSPDDTTLPEVFKELGVTKIQYGGRLDWEPFWVFVSFTSVSNHWSDSACTIIWERMVEDHNHVAWTNQGNLRLYKPVSMQTNLWQGLRKMANK